MYLKRSIPSQVIGRTCGLGLFWLTGLAVGIGTAAQIGAPWTSLAGVLSQNPVHPLGLLVNASLPLLGSVVLFRLAGRAGIYCICLLRALLLGLTVGALGSALHASAPEQILILFTGLISAPFLLVFWWRRLCIGEQFLWEDAASVLGLELLIVGIDAWGIAPYVAELLNF